MLLLSAVAVGHFTTHLANPVELAEHLVSRSQDRNGEYHFEIHSE